MSKPTNIRATTYCQAPWDTQPYNYGSAYGTDLTTFLGDLASHEQYCHHWQRPVVRIDVSYDLDGERRRESFETFAAVVARFAPQEIDPRSPFTPFDCGRCGKMAPCVPKGHLWCETCRQAFSTYPPIPVTATLFQHGYGYEEPTELIAWEWRPDFGHWGAYVTFADGWTGGTSPRPYDNPPVFGPPSFLLCYECGTVFAAVDADPMTGCPRCPMCSSGELDPAEAPASHSDQDIDRHNDDDAPPELFCDLCMASTDHTRKDCPFAWDEDDSDDPTSVFYETPSVVVTASGIQFMLPGETPPPAKKGGADQTRMF